MSLITEDRYGVARVCQAFGLPRSTYYARRKRQQQGDEAARSGRRPGPEPELSDAELAEEIREVLEASSFVGEGYRKAYARLKAKGIPCGKERVRRVMGEYGLLAPKPAGNPHGPKAHDGKITTDVPDEMWGTDATSCRLLAGATATIFVVVDHCTSECLGIHASLCGDRYEALQPLHQAVREVFGTLEEDAAHGIRLRHDHGPQFISEDYQDEIAFLGLDSSPAYIREPEGNGCSERFIRTLKEQLLWLETFETIEELQRALQAFKDRFNHEWLVQRHGHRTPSQVRADLTEDHLGRAA